VDGLIDPNAPEEEITASGNEEDLEVEEEEESEEGEGAAMSASLLQLKADALERFETIRALYSKMLSALQKKGAEDKTYLKSQQAISNELLNIRFTARMTERLCDSVRSLVEQSRSHERKILALCVDKSHMPRPHFIKVFPGNETNMEWLKAEIASNKPYSGALMRAAPAIIEEQQKIIDLQNRLRISKRSTSRCRQGKQRLVARNAK
jgi:RNA polymerase primary sigma factor